MTTATMPATTASSDLAAVKARQQGMWASGDFAVIGTTLQIVGEMLCEAVDLGAGERVLDVAAGNGNATLAAARRFADVTSTDYVPALLEGGRRRAEANGLAVRFEAADAENLPYADGRFEVVLSTFGVMFAPDHQRAARELMRVCRPGGRIGLAWTPGGFLGDLFRAVAKYVPPVPGVQSPLLWGTDAHVRACSRRRQDQHTPLLRVPLPVGGALRGHLPHVLRAGPPGVCRPRCAARPRSRRTCWLKRRPPGSWCPGSISRP